MSLAVNEVMFWALLKGKVGKFSLLHTATQLFAHM